MKVETVKKLIESLLKEKKSVILNGTLDSAIEKALKKAYQEAYCHINENAVRHVDSFNKQLEEQVKKSITITTGQTILPDDCKLHMQAGTTDLFVIEQKPQMRTLWCSNSILLNSKLGFADYKFMKHVWVSLPFVVFILVLKNKQFFNLIVTYRNSSITSVEDSVYCSNLPNISNTDRLTVCVGDMIKSKDVDFSGNTSEKINKLFGKYWQSSFNKDYTANFLRMAIKYPKQLGGMTAWEEASKDDPSFITKIEWEQGHQLRSLMAGYISDGERGFSKKFEPILEKYLENIKKEFIKHILTSKKVIEKLPSDIKADDLVKGLKPITDRLAKEMLQEQSEHLLRLGQKPVKPIEKDWDYSPWGDNCWRKYEDNM